MAGIASGGGRNRRRGRAVGDREEGPAAIEARAVLDVHLHPHDAAALIVPVLIDRALARRTAYLHDQHGLVRPGPGALEGAVSFRIDEHVREHGMAHGEN